MRNRQDSRTPLVRVVVLALLLAGLFVATAQDPVESEESYGAELGAPLTLFSVGVTAGFPSYQSVAVAASIQAQYVGLQLKASWTAVGPYVAGQLRGYVPLPVPVPVYLGAGGGVYGKNASYHFVIGTHVPLGKNLRLDVEAGAANVPLLADRAWAPHISVGASYALPVDLTAVASSAADPAGAAQSGPQEGQGVGSGRCEDSPDADAVRGAVHDTVDDWLRSAQATYGSVYRDLSYNYQIRNVSIRGSDATVTVSYSGSVVEILTGKSHRASGTATATFRWSGCRWANTGIDY